jgi:uncharacterized protein YqjF (DUF2071 family)
MPGPGPLTTARRQAAALRETAHRPWPLPKGMWLQGQSWVDLLFAHWPLAPARLERLVPGMPVDTFEGRAWLGLTPFVLEGLRLAGTPPVPGLSTFPETNVRTYVTVDDKPGIYFFSLDAASRLAVEAARRLYHVPYFRARMSARRSNGWVTYESRRIDARGPDAELRCRYRPTGDVRNATPGTLDYFLTERYCMYTLGPDGGLRRAEIHHPPWPLQDAELELELNTMPPPGIELPDDEPDPLLHFAACQDTVIWPLQGVR